MKNEPSPLEQVRSMAWHRARLLMSVSALTGFGIIMVYSASAVRAARGGGWEMSYAYNQVWWLMVAVFALTAMTFIPYQWWLRARYLVLLTSYGLLALVLTPFGTRVNGASRWLRFGGLNVQPSELAKIGMIVAIAAFLAKIPNGKPRFFRHVIPLCVFSGVPIVLVLKEPDVGTSALLACALGVLMLAGGVRVWQFLLLIAPAVPAAAFYGYSKFEYVQHRIHSWMAGDSFHTNVSKLAIGSGGIWGVGLGQGPAKLDYLPEAHTDFIFAMIGQETGLVGALSLVALFVILVWQGLIISRNAGDRFGSLLAFGASVVIGGQAAFNMGVVTGLLPPKGISLPFVSFGGSGLVVFYSMIGLMVSVTRGVRVPEKKPCEAKVRKFKPIPAFAAGVPRE